MVTLGKIERRADNQALNLESMEADIVALYKSSGLQSSLDAGGEFHGWLTAEPTPGHLNYNPGRKLAAVRFYEHEPQTRRGYYAKLHIMQNGDLISV